MLAPAGGRLASRRSLGAGQPENRPRTPVSRRILPSHEHSKLATPSSAATADVESAPNLAATWRFMESLTILYGSLTLVVHKPSIGVEQATSSYSFRSPELSQPI